MSYYVLKQPERVRTARRVAAALIVLTAVVSLATGYVLSRPIVVVVDGARVEIEADTTVSDIRARGVLKAPAGDLLSVRGSVAATEGGAPPRVLRNGRPATNWQRLYRGDVLVSRAGEDRTESIETTDVPIPYRTVVQGTGAVMKVRVPGEEGTRRVTRGSVSQTELSSEVLVPPRDEVLVRRSPKPGSKLVAITFDDGPWPKWTEEVLRVLREEDVPATFFVLGRQVKRYPSMTKRIAAEGHMVASHSMTHKRFSQLKPAQIRRETLTSRALLRDTTRVSSPWIRPPYGAMDTQAWRELRRLRARVVMWDVDPKDWKRPGSRRIATRVVRAVKPGSIVLLHDGGGDRQQTVWALQRIIPALRRKGYEFVTVEELVKADGVAKEGAATALASYRPE